MNHQIQWLSFTALRFALSVLSLSGAAIASDSTPLYPEDGSMRVSHWTSSQRFGLNIASGTRFRAAMKAEGVTHRVVPGQFDYLQDLGFFDVHGHWIVNAPYSGVISNPDHFFGLTLAVANEDWGPVYVNANKAKAAGLKVARQMKITFAEGGALLSGRRANGVPYVVSSQDLLDRAIAFSGLSSSAAKTQVAEDLGVSESNLILLPQVPSHLDLIMILLPEGRVILDEPRLQSAALSRAIELTQDPEQILRLKQIKKRPKDEFQIKILDSIAEHLRSHGLKVYREAGVFEEAPSAEEPFKKRHINFLNGFHGLGATGKRFLMTNDAHGLVGLEQFWSETYARLAGTDPERVYFIGRAGGSDGLDCSGLPSLSSEPQ